MNSYLLTTDDLKEFVKILEEEHFNDRLKFIRKYDENYKPYEIEFNQKVITKSIARLKDKKI